MTCPGPNRKKQFRAKRKSSPSKGYFQMGTGDNKNDTQKDARIERNVRRSFSSKGFCLDID